MIDNGILKTYSEYDEWICLLNERRKNGKLEGIPLRGNMFHPALGVTENTEIQKPIKGGTNHMAHTIICLAGSLKFYDTMMKVQEELSRNKYIVLAPTKDPRYEVIGIPEEDLREYDKIQDEKIDLSDILYVINVDGYIGKSTRREIEYAKSHNKVVIYKYPEKEQYDQMYQDFKASYRLVKLMAEILGVDILEKVSNETVGRRENPPEIITLCGSRKYVGVMQATANRMAMDGNITLLPAIFDMDEFTLTDKDHAVLDQLHRDKIDISDMVYIVNPEGYIGDDTRKEIEYATSKGIPIEYLEDPE